MADHRVSYFLGLHRDCLPLRCLSTPACLCREMALPGMIDPATLLCADGSFQAGLYPERPRRRKTSRRTYQTLRAARGEFANGDDCVPSRTTPSATLQPGAWRRLILRTVLAHNSHRVTLARHPALPVYEPYPAVPLPSRRLRQPASRCLAASFPQTENLALAMFKPPFPRPTVGTASSSCRASLLSTQEQRSSAAN